MFAAHQLGAGVAAAGAGWIRDAFATYDPAFYIAAGLCGGAALFRLTVSRRAVPTAPSLA